MHLEPPEPPTSPWPLLSALRGARQRVPQGVWRRGAGQLSQFLAGLAGAARCVACDCALDASGVGFCQHCSVPSSPALRQLNGLWVLAGGRFDPTLREAIHRLKYSGQADVVEGLSRWWLARLSVALDSAHTAHPADICLNQPDAQSLDAERRQIPRDNTAPLRLVPVPLHPTRLVERGYNQAALLASEVAPRLGARTAFCLKRVRATEAQANLGRSARAQNIEAAFSASRPRSTSTVILVDDVATTGATLGAAAQALRNRGISCVGALVLAIVR